MKEKEYTITVANAEPGQLISLRCELNLLSKQWRPYGPVIKVEGMLPEANDKSLRLQAASAKQVAKKWAVNLVKW
jgi:hypothetical protein